MSSTPRSAGEHGIKGQSWTTQEIDATVEAYLGMLDMQLTGQTFTKATIVRRLGEQLPARSARAIEAKFQNISAILDELDIAWIEGYRPYAHYQGSLRTGVIRRIGEGHAVRESLSAYETSNLVAAASKPQATPDVMVPTPSRARAKGRRSSVLITGTRYSALRDFQARDLGRAGERWVLGLEREMLRRSGRDDLAEAVRWVANDDGDGAGFDIHSYRPDGQLRRIEVKTTNYGIRTPFFITRWEVDVSRSVPDEYSLYRVHGFARDPRIYVLEGSVETQVRLEPTVFLGLLTE